MRFSTCQQMHVLILLQSCKRMFPFDSLEVFFVVFCVLCVMSFLGITKLLSEPYN